MKEPKGWFVTPGRHGDRTISQQMSGLGELVKYVPGKSVLDVGCAEGLISSALMVAGAKSVMGVEIVPGHIEMAKAMNSETIGLGFMVGDANDFEPTIKYDVVIMLAILHKLRNPTEACKRIVAWCTDLCVIRLPPSGPVIVDKRSEEVPFDIAAAMQESGFRLERIAHGPFREWVGYFKRNHGAR